ncbi:uncharacterized protein LOC143298110 isoform X2 [Babylonia areolata]|uniref:uncharacterized protein LOC143298110 isoform X2 n=1 Tax=Babylonia areolata TaxID=304850 RepID=UPI003FD0F6DE
MSVVSVGVLVCLGVGVWVLGPEAGGSTCSSEKECSLTQIKCGPEEAPIITEAYHLQQPDPSLCDNYCQPTSSENAQRCFTDSYGDGKCYPRFSLMKLNEIYGALDSDQGKLSANEREINEDDGPCCLRHECVPVTSSDVNPCQTGHLLNHGNQINNVTYLFVPPHRSRRHDSNRRPCHKLCRLQDPEGHIKVETNFLMQEAASDRTSYLEYRLVMTTGVNTNWERVNSSYHKSGNLFGNIEEVQLRINIEDMSLITRLWVSLGGPGVTFNLSCVDEGDTITSSETLSSESPDSELDDQGTTFTYIVAICPVLFVAALGVCCVFYIRKRQPADQVSSQQATQLTGVPAIHCDDVTPRHDVTNTSSSRQDAAATGDCSSVLLRDEAGSGNDDGEYGRLDRDGNRNEIGAGGQCDVYDHTHTTPRQPPASADLAASQQASEVYALLRHQPERQAVVDNVYDSTR